MIVPSSSPTGNTDNDISMWPRLVSDRKANEIVYPLTVRRGFQIFSVNFKQHSTANSIGIRLSPLNCFNDLIKNEISVSPAPFDLDAHRLTCLPKRVVNSRVELANFESRP